MQKTSRLKRVKDYFPHVSTIFVRHQFSGLFWGALICACHSELTEFLAELTKFGLELTEFLLRSSALETVLHPFPSQEVSEHGFMYRSIQIDYRDTFAGGN